MWLPLLGHSFIPITESPSIIIIETRNIHHSVDHTHSVLASSTLYY